MVVHVMRGAHLASGTKPCPAIFCQTETSCGSFTTPVWSPNFGHVFHSGSGSLFLNASGTISVGAEVCLTYTLCDGGVTPCLTQGWSPWVQLDTLTFNETYTESLLVSATVTGHSFTLYSKNTPSSPWPGFSIFTFDIMDFDYYAELDANLWLNLSIEYGINLEAGTSIALQQGSAGYANQSLSLNTTAPVTAVNSEHCTLGTPSSDCTTLTSASTFGQSPSFAGMFWFRFGPQLSLGLTLGVLDQAVLTLASLWGYFYWQVSLLLGVNVHTAFDESQGNCGSGYKVEGLPYSPTTSDGNEFANMWWAVGCTSFGFQWGVSILPNTLFSTIFSELTNTYGPYVIAGAPIASTVVVCDTSQSTCTSTFTGSDPVQLPETLGMAKKEKDSFLTYTPIVPVGAKGDSLPVTFGTPVNATTGKAPCGTLTTVGTNGMKFKAPSFSGYCDINVTTGLLITDGSFQVSQLTFRIGVYTPLAHAIIISDYIFTAQFCSIIVFRCFGQGPFSSDPPPWSVTLTPCLPCGTKNETFVANSTSDNVTFAAVPNGVYNYQIDPPSGLVSTNGTGSGQVNLTAEDVYLPVSFAPMSVTFEESGLAPGTLWSVRVGGVSQTVAFNNTTFTIDPGTYSYVITPPTGFYVSPSNVGNVTATDRNQTVDVTFTTEPIVQATPAVTYPVDFDAKGTGDTTVAADVDGVEETGYSAPVFDLKNGTHAYVLASYEGYFSKSPSGSFKIVGAAKQINVSFLPAKYNVTIQEAGLPANHSWSVVFNGGFGSVHHTTTTDEMTFPAANGTAAYSVVPIPGFENPNGSVGEGLVEGANLLLVVDFDRVYYPVFFNETGLPENVTFAATINGLTVGTIIANDVTWLAWDGLLSNGTYHFAIVNASHYPGRVIEPSTGKFTIKGGPVLLNITAAPVTYKVKFKEVGLPAGTNWTVEFGVYTLTSNNTSITFSVPNGTYVFDAKASGYGEVDGDVTVNGANVTVKIVFKPT